MHGSIGHRTQVDPEAELVVGEIFGQGHVGRAAPVWVEVTGQFLPHVAATDALVVNPVGHTVDSNLNIGDVGVEELFSVLSPGNEGVDEKQQNTLERPALGVDTKVEAGIRASGDGHHPFTHDEIVRELLAALVSAEGLFGQSLASNDLILQLNILQLVNELASI